MNLVTSAVRLVRAAQKAYARKWTFLVLFLGCFFTSFSALAFLDIVPDPAAPVAPTVTVSETTPLIAAVAAAPIVAEAPVRIEIPRINLSAAVANPSATDAEVLDTALLKGAVRYPSSAKLGEEGNVIIFGHSSYLPVVNNQAYKTFNGIQNLVAGDVITVYSSDRAYEYKVDSVAKEDANSAAIPLSVTGSTLTLSTCNSFATKSDRFVVTATLASSHLIGN